MSTEGTHIFMLVLTFEDGTTGGHLVHRGTFEECDRAADEMPGFATTPEEKKVAKVEKWVGTVAQFEKATGRNWTLQ